MQAMSESEIRSIELPQWAQEISRVLTLAEQVSAESVGWLSSWLLFRRKRCERHVLNGRRLASLWPPISQQPPPSVDPVQYVRRQNEKHRGNGYRQS
jgi:hypothetical protein